MNVDGGIRSVLYGDDWAIWTREQDATSVIGKIKQAKRSRAIVM